MYKIIIFRVLSMFHITVIILIMYTGIHCMCKVCFLEHDPYIVIKCYFVRLSIFLSSSRFYYFVLDLPSEFLPENIHLYICIYIYIY